MQIEGEYLDRLAELSGLCRLPGEGDELLRERVFVVWALTGSPVEVPVDHSNEWLFVFGNLPIG